MPSCSVVVCKNRSDQKLKGVTFHRFPHESSFKEKWINSTGRGPDWWPTKQSTICSMHFEDIFFKPNTKTRRLFEWAVPTLKLRLVFAKLDTNTSRNLQHLPVKIPMDIEPQTEVSDIDAAKKAEDESDYEAEKEVEVWAESESAEAAEVLSCDECGQAADSGGKLYQCVECPRVVCAACEREERHRQHCLLRLPSRAVYDKLRTLYESLRDTVTAHLAGDDDDAVPKQEHILPDPLNTTSNEEFIQQYNDYPKQVETGNPNHLLVEAPSLIKTEPELITDDDDATLSVPVEIARKSVRATKSVTATTSVLASKSVPAAESLLKHMLQARVSKQPITEPISKLRGNHGHSYTVMSSDATKKTYSDMTRPTSSTEGSESTTTAKRKKLSQIDDDEPICVKVEIFETEEEF